MEKNIHHGQNIKRFREMLGFKQEAFAAALGKEWTQRRVSLLEGKEEIEERLLQQVAMVLRVPTEAIKNFDQEAALNFISSMYLPNNDLTENNFQLGHPCCLNPIDKIVELYERMLKEKQELIDALKKTQG
jgi:transcriptional regulator with XRE-family HTH domain